MRIINKIKIYNKKINQDSRKKIKFKIILKIINKRNNLKLINLKVINLKVNKA